MKSCKPCKHKFQPRYDDKYVTVIEEILSKGQVIEQVGAPLAVPYLKEHTYIYDICIKCGKIIKRM
ncbi:MAG: hypothetical protein ACTSUP_07885 [Candidatus Heimdallarchaeaceae archaeon]